MYEIIRGASMKTLIIYYSATENTEKIAKIFADKTNADTVNLKYSTEITLDQYDLIGFGSGIYKETMSPKLFSCLDRLDLKGKQVFAFSTSGMGTRFYNLKLARRLKAKGAKYKGNFACKGGFVGRNISKNRLFEAMSKLAIGHPDNRDIAKADRFIEKITGIVKK